jgi:hypothetical protein
MSMLSTPHRMVRKYLSVRWVTGVEKQTLGIPFRTIPRKRTQLGIPIHAKKIETIFRNAVPNYSVEEKPTQNKTRQPNMLKKCQKRHLLMYKQMILLNYFAAVS